MIEHLIALPGSYTTLFQYQNAVQTHTKRTGRRQHGVVALSLSGRHDQIIPLFLGIGQQIFQLSDLVAAQSYTAQVIPLDPNIGPKLTADIGQSIKRCRK